MVGIKPFGSSLRVWIAKEEENNSDVKLVVESDIHFLRWKYVFLKIHYFK